MTGIYSVAIDGPSGSGKSTAAKMLAEKLNITYVDTGAMYRAVGLYCINNSVPTKNGEAVRSVLGNIDITFKTINGERRIFLNGTDVTDTIRTQDAGMAASDVAAIPAVREKLVDMQRNIAKDMSVVMDGRDIGTNVLKNADVKLYIDASVEERTKRRIGELNGKGIKTDFNTVKDEIEQRDYNDTHRKLNPLRKAEDAVEIVTDGMSAEEVRDIALDIIKRRLG